jgi:hypothetical protein
MRIVSTVFILSLRVCSTGSVCWDAVRTGLHVAYGTGLCEYIHAGCALSVF